MEVLTKLYILTWSITQLLPMLDELVFYAGHGGIDARPNVPMDWYLTLPALVMTLLWLLLSVDDDGPSSKWMAAVAHVVDLAGRMQRMPKVWDHEQWAILLEVSFVLHVAFGWTQADLARTCRQQFGILYAAATFWKINPSFMNPSTSCGTVVILEFAAAYLPPLPPWLVDWLGHYAAHLTLVVEGLVSVLMFAACSERRRLCRNAALVLACLFHWTIFVMPVNSAGGFSMDCVARFVFLFTTREIVQCGETIQYMDLAWFVVIPATLVQARAITVASEPYDFNYLGFCMILVFYGLLMYRGGGTVSKKSSVETKNDKGKADVATTRTTAAALSQWFVLLLTFSHAFVFTILGIQHMGAPTMYSNLNYYFGGNHYLVPLGVLGDDLLHGGQLVQIHHSTSARLNRRIGHVRSDLLWSAQAQRYMHHSTGMVAPVQYFSLCMMNEPARTLMEDVYMKSNPLGSPNHVPFLLPMSAVNQELKEARLAGEDFSVTISNVDEPIEQALVVQSDGKCQVYDASRVCNEETDKLVQLLLHPSLRGSLVHRFIDSILAPYPRLLDGLDEEACMT